MPHKADKAAGAVIRRVRQRTGITQEALAERIGMSYQQVQKYETGVNRISVSRLFDIAEALDTDAHAIVRLVEFDLKANKEF